MLFGAFGLMIYAAVFASVVWGYGWIATLLVMLGIPFLAGAFLCFVFPETAVLAPILALMGGFLVICGGVAGWNYPPAKAGRIRQRQYYRDAVNFIDANREPLRERQEPRIDRRFIDENQRLRRR